jgi:hypothetical protein
MAATPAGVSHPAPRSRGPPDDSFVAKTVAWLGETAALTSSIEV